VTSCNDESPIRIAYVVKRYPRFSETFVVNEILAHEAAGAEIQIFALHPPADTHFQPAIAAVRAPVTYLLGSHIRADMLWSLLQRLGSELPDFWNQLGAAENASGTELYQAARLALEVRSRGITHIHAHFATTAASVARLASLFTGVPYTFTAHAKDIFHELVDPVELAQKLAGAAGVVTVSDFNVRFMAGQFHESAHKLRRIYNGLDLNQFAFTAPDERPPKIVAVGRFIEKKGFGDLIDACAVLRGWGVEFQCEIIGGGELVPSLAMHIRDLNLESAIQLAGSRPLNYVQQSLRQAALLAVPCVTAANGDRDGLPTVLLEAMALGTPCVGTSVTGIPEAIRNEETGLLVPERQPQELAVAIQRLLADGELRVRIARAARSLVERQFDIHRNAAELRAFFSACQRASARPLALAEVG
jgi:glycosyltransferase involved in cell wall biosynthesis